MNALKFIVITLRCLSAVLGNAQESNLTFIIPDTIAVELIEGRIETIDIEISLRNNSNHEVILNIGNGITQIGIGKGIVPLDSVPREFPPDLCKTIDYRGRGFWMYLFNNKSQTIFDTPNLSKGILPYFNSKGRLRYTNVGKRNHILKSCNIGKVSNRNIIKLSPYQNYTYKTGVYLGDYKLKNNSKYYLILVYNNIDNKALSEVCLKSNRIVILTN